MAGIFDLLPQPQLETPVPLDESERIDEITTQLRLLDPYQRMKSYDPLGWQQKSKSVDLGDGHATTGRTKSDVGKAILSTLFEGIKAAGGGRSYENPWEKQFKQYTEDYKREAPRLIDESRILNQNKRQYQADQARENVQRIKNEASVAAANIAAKAKQYQTDKTFQNATERNKILAAAQDFVNKHGKNAKAEDIALVRTITEDISKSTPEQAAQVAQAFEDRKLREMANKGTINYLTQPNLVNQNFTSTRDYLDSATGEMVRATTNTTRPIRQSPGPEKLNILQQLRQAGRSKTPANPLMDALSSFGKTAPVQNATPAPQPNEVVPGLPTPAAKPQGQPQTQPQPQNQAQAYRPIGNDPKLRSDNTTPGAVTQTRTLAVKTDDTSTFRKEPPKDFKGNQLVRWKPEDFGLDSDPATAKFVNAANYDNVIGFAPTADGKIRDIDSDVVIEPKFYGPAAVRRKNQQDFQTFRDAVYALNSFANIAALQYYNKKGNLFTGISGYTGRPAEDALDKTRSIRKGGPIDFFNKAITKADFGRLPDSVDQYIALLTTESYLRKIYESTGKQINPTEMEKIAQTWVSVKDNPDAFMERLLQLTLKANRKLYQQYKNFKEDNRQFNLGDLYADTDAYAVRGAREILGRIKSGKYKPTLLRPDIEL